jgi:hypothetical protein
VVLSGAPSIVAVFTPSTTRRPVGDVDPGGFVDQLRALEHAQDGQATLGDPDEKSGDEFGLTIRLKQGRGTLDGFLTDSTAARLSFELIDIDRAFVRDALAQFAAIVEAFPVRGDVTAD